MEVKLGIIGGSGLYKLEGIEEVREVSIGTPFGKPSDDIIIGKINGKEVAFLPRHGRGHKVLPGEINYRANIYAMKKLGVQSIISVSAVGSLREDYAPGDLIVVDQFYDHTKGRKSTFFGEGIVGHISMADPICMNLANTIYKLGQELNLPVKKGGTYICIEGPQFSSKAESNVYRKWGMDVIGMTNMPEAKLAREAGICYSTIACITDYDCWHTDHDSVTVEMVVKTANENVEKAKKLLSEIINKYNEINCNCKGDFAGAIMTAEDKYPEETYKKLDIFFK